MNVMVRRRHPLLVAERYEACREAGVPEEEAITWAYTRSVTGNAARLAEVAADWWLCGFGYAAAVGWIRLLGKDGSCAAQNWRSKGFTFEQVRVLMRQVNDPLDRLAWRDCGIPGERVRRYIEEGLTLLEAARREFESGHQVVGHEALGPAVRASMPNSPASVGTHP